jgi:hypothetical protein
MKEGRMKRSVRPDTGGQRGQGGPRDQEQRAPHERDTSEEKQRNDEPRGK